MKSSIILRPGTGPENAAQVLGLTVCGNAIDNREVDLGVFVVCRDTSAGKATKRYAAMTTPHKVAAVELAIVLAAR